ncbi:25670_t:CDS:2, partial [Dentiscutata erythropus]
SVQSIQTPVSIGIRPTSVTVRGGAKKRMSGGGKKAGTGTRPKPITTEKNDDTMLAQSLSKIANDYSKQVQQFGQNTPEGQAAYKKYVDTMQALEQHKRNNQLEYNNIQTIQQLRNELYRVTNLLQQDNLVPTMKADLVNRANILNQLSSKFNSTNSNTGTIQQQPPPQHMSPQSPYNSPRGYLGPSSHMQDVRTTLMPHLIQNVNTNLPETPVSLSLPESDDGDKQLLSKRKIQQLVDQIDPKERLEPEVEE